MSSWKSHCSVESSGSCVLPAEQEQSERSVQFTQTEFGIDNWICWGESAVCCILQSRERPAACVSPHTVWEQVDGTFFTNLAMNENIAMEAVHNKDEETCNLGKMHEKITTTIQLMKVSDPKSCDYKVTKLIHKKLKLNQNQVPKSNLDFKHELYLPF